MRPLLAVFLLFAATSAHAEGLRVLGEGKTQTLDPEQFDKEQRARYEIFKVRCTKCHPMARPISAVQTGITPVSGSPFNQEAVKTYVLKMMRKPNSGISREDAKEILLFLRYVLEVAHPEPPPVEPAPQ